MKLKRDNWTNQEVIKILDLCKIHIDDKDRVDKHMKILNAHNAGIEQAIIRFLDFKADPDSGVTAMAYDTESEQIFVVSPPLPQ